jgi:hypothetical protein
MNFSLSLMLSAIKLRGVLASQIDKLIKFIGQPVKAYTRLELSACRFFREHIKATELALAIDSDLRNHLNHKTRLLILLDCHCFGSWRESSSI